MSYDPALAIVGIPSGETTPMLAPQNYQRALSLRHMAMTYDDLPRYRWHRKSPPVATDVKLAHLPM